MTDLTQLNALNTHENPLELWDAFKCETLQAPREYNGGHPRSESDFASEEAVENTEKSRAPLLAGNRDRCRAHLRLTSVLLRKGKESYVKSLAREAKGHSSVNDIQPAYWAK